MTIDDRIDKLTERHEALTQTIELMVLENRERDARWDERAAKQDERIGKIGVLVLQVVESTQRLAAIAESHERRITSIEGRAS